MIQSLPAFLSERNGARMTRLWWIMHSDLSKSLRVIKNLGKRSFE